MTKKAIVLLADGYEDVEAVTPIDYLRRAGIEVTSASITENLIVTSRWGGIKITADTTLAQILKQDISIWDAVILPGGIPGATALAASEETALLLKKMASYEKLICAICASPVLVLAPLGLLKEKKYTCYMGYEEKTTDGHWLEERVVTDGNIITSRAAGTTGEWSIAIINALLGSDEGKKIMQTVLL